ncbi:MAG: serine hydrolase domain-containing protein, partial [Bacteroidota bacterium]
MRALFLLSVFFYLSSSIHAQLADQIADIMIPFSGSENAGASVAILKEGRLIFQAEYGMANLEYEEAMDAQTIIALGSVSKHFTTLALLLLEDRGLLSLDDSIHDYLPELPDYGRPISLRQIAWHVSGIRSNLELLGLQGFGPADALSSQFVRQMIFDQSKLNFSPGEDWSYSNSGYFLLADVVAIVSGQDFEDFMETEIFSPLGMDQTFVMTDYEAILPNRSYSYYQLPDGSYINAIMNRSSIGSTGIWTTMENFIKWGENFTSYKLGSRDLFSRLTTEGELLNGRGIDYGLGLALGEYHGVPMYHHGGGTSGYRSYLSHLP